MIPFAEFLSITATFPKNNMQMTFGHVIALVVSTLQTLQQCRSFTLNPKLNLIYAWMTLGSLVFSGQNRTSRMMRSFFMIKSVLRFINIQN